MFKSIVLFLLTILVVPIGKAESAEQRIKVVLRKIGHEFLLQLDDSTSRVLPIEKIEGRYAIKLEREFSLVPDLLFFATFKTLEESNSIDKFIVEVEQCETKEVVHSFEASLIIDKNNIACKERALPKSCYVFYFTVIENNIPLQSKSKRNYLYVLLIPLFGVVAYLFLKKKSTKQNIDLIEIGQFHLDKNRMILLFKEQKTELSSKETDLLFYLVSNENKTLERDTILNVIWGDEGSYVGRTLDVFISKLRKKLEADPSIKIINIRGIGYRFVMNYS